MLHHSDLPYLSKLIETKQIIIPYNHPQAGHFQIKKTSKFVTKKYYTETLKYNVKTHIKVCNVYLVLKAVRHKLY